MAEAITPYMNGNGDLANWKPRFFTIWTGQAISMFGSSLVQFALVWWLTVSTRSATVLATATLVALLPQIIIGPLAGTLVDRWNRRTVMIIADSSIALATLLLAYLFASGNIQIWHVYVVMLYRSAAGAFQQPAMQASTSLMVPKQHLARVGGANQALSGAMTIISPAIGAALLAALPLQGVLMIDVSTALLAVVPLLFFHIPQPLRSVQETGETRQKPSFWREFGEGLRYVRGWPGLMAIMGMAMLLNFLLNPAFSLLPLLVTNHFGGNAPELAALESTVGIGMLLGGITLSVWGGFRRRVVTTMVGLIGLGLGTILLGGLPSSAFGFAVAAMFIVGFMQPICNGPLFAIFQSTVAPEMQGRVMGLLGSAATAMSPLSLLVAGPVADAISIRGWYIIAGTACIVMAILGFMWPAVMNIETQRQPAQETAPQETPTVTGELDLA